MSLVKGSDVFAEESSSPSGNAVAFRGSFQLLRLIFPRGGNRRVVLAASEPVVTSTKRGRAESKRPDRIECYWNKDGNEQITGYRRVARQGQDD